MLRTVMVSLILIIVAQRKMEIAHSHTFNKISSPKKYRNCFKQCRFLVKKLKKWKNKSPRGKVNQFLHEEMLSKILKLNVQERRRSWTNWFHFISTETLNEKYIWNEKTFSFVKKQSLKKVLEILDNKERIGSNPCGVSVCSLEEAQKLKKLPLILNGKSFFKVLALTLLLRTKRFPYTGGNFGILSLPQRAEADYLARVFILKSRPLFLISQTSLFVRVERIELSTSVLSGQRSTTELHARLKNYIKK